MNRFQQVLALIAALTEEAGKIFALAEKEARDLNADEIKRDDEITAELEALNAEKTRLERHRDRQRNLQAVPRTTVPAASIEPDATETETEETVAVREPNDALEFDGTFGEFLFAVRALANPSRTDAIDPRIHRIAAASGVQQGVPSEGGLLVTPTFRDTIWDELNQAPNNMLGMTDSFTVEGESLTMHANAETSRATGSRYGGIQGYWIAEAAKMTGSKPKWRDLKLEPKELAVLCFITDKQLRNARATEQFVTRAARDEILFLVGNAIFNGDGQGKPLGLMQSSSLITVAKETGQTNFTVNGTNVSKMWSRLHATARRNAIWLYNQEIEPQLDAMTLTAGNELVYLPAGGGARALADNPEPRLKGRPMVPVEYAEALGTKGDLVLWDPTSYASGIRGDGVREAMSIHVRFEWNESAFRFLFEVDGQPWLQKALTPFKGTNTLSTAVALADRKP